MANQAKMNKFLARMEERRAAIGHRSARSDLIRGLDERFYDRIESIKSISLPNKDLIEEQRREIAELKDVLAEYAASIPAYELKRAQDLLRAVENQLFNAPTPEIANGHSNGTQENGQKLDLIPVIPSGGGFSFRKAPPPAPPLLTRGTSELLGVDSAPGSPRSSPSKAPPRTRDPTAPTGYRIPKTITGQDGQTIRIETEMDGGDLVILGMKSCRILISAKLSTLQLKTLKSSVVIGRPVANSIMISDCERCEFVVGCQQLRCHSSVNCDFYLFASSSPVIEDCSGVRFAPYMLPVGGEKENLWNDVKDFDWLTTSEKSPNWEIIPEQDRVNNFSLE